MRPKPRPKHLPAVLILLAAGAASGYLAFRDERLSDDQINYAASAARRHDPGLLRHDSIYGKIHADGNLWRLDSPVFLSMMELVLIPSGHKDMLLPFRVFAGPMTALFLCGMYMLMYQQCRSSTVSCFTALLSMSIIHTFGHWIWGIGSLASITPHGLVVAFSPMVLYIYLSNSDNPRIYFSFLMCGLAANIHLAAASNLGMILLLTHACRNSLRPGALLTTLAGAGVFLLGAAPYLGYFINLKMSMESGGGSISETLIHQSLRIGDEPIMYPDMLKDLMRWGLHAAGMALLSGIVLWRLGRFRARNTGFWLWMAGLSTVVSMGFHGVAQMAWHLGGTSLPTIDLVQASVWIMLPLFVLLAQSLTNLSRLARKNVRYLRWGCAIFMAAWLLPSDNLRTFRHIIYESCTFFMDKESKPLRLIELDEREKEETELNMISLWARHNTDRSSVFLTEEMIFRALSWRSMFVSRADVRHLYYMKPTLLGEWNYRIEKQYEWLNEPIDPEKMTSDIKMFSVDSKYSSVREWYVILPAHLCEKKLDPLEEVSGSGWGHYFRVFRIPVEN